MSDILEDGGRPLRPPAPEPSPATGDANDAAAPGPPPPGPSPFAGSVLNHLHYVMPITVTVDFDVDELVDLIMERMAKRQCKAERGRNR